MLYEILRLLREKDEFVSGEKISAELGITRTAVWKKIKTLRAAGFIIKAVPSRGYRLMTSPELSIEDISAQVVDDFWKAIVFHKAVDSTNDLAVTLAERQEVALGAVIVADAQRKGRGRLGRAWLSPPGVNIYMSIVVRPEIPPRHATLLTVVAALACARALRQGSGLRVSIKWPNDLMLSGKKLGGILTEVRSDPDRIRLAIVGIGINVNIEARDFPDEMATIATSIKIETGMFHRRTDIIVLILQEFEYWYKTLQSKGRLFLIEEWRRLSSTIGEKVSITVGQETFSGIAEDIDDEGMLLVRLPSGVLKRVSTGDLTVLEESP
jgi:BirA family transcriptional regulator, biotin operon repressor / biotin---[acetyl-CoA-carboxylase] ligase